MTRRACSRVSHHVTAFFIPEIRGSPLESGSRGAGLVVDPPVKACVSPAGSPPSAYGRTVELAMRKVGAPDVRIEVFEPLPPARGYASSAATALAASLAAALYKGLPVSRALRASHEAEVEAGTGLGDVVAIASGGYGVAVRLKAGGPGVAVVDSIPVPRSVLVLSVELGSMETRELLASYTQEMAREAEASLARLAEFMTFEVFAEEARRYTEATGLAKTVPQPLLEAVSRLPGLISFYVKKRLLVIIVEEDRAQDAVSELSKAGGRPKILEVAGGGPRIGWV